MPDMHEVRSAQEVSREVEVMWTGNMCAYMFVGMYVCMHACILLTVGRRQCLERGRKVKRTHPGIEI